MGKLSLEKPYARFLKETAWLLAEFDWSVREVRFAPVPTRQARLAAEMCVMRLDDAWARFCRELVILSAGCAPLTVAGLRVPRAAGISARREVIPRLFAISRGFNREPDWGTTDKCLDAARRLQIVNFSTIAAALGATVSPAHDVRQFRNFLAHRYIGTVDRIKQRAYYQSALRIQIDQLPMQLVPPGVTLMENWITRFRLVAAAAIQ